MISEKVSTLNDDLRSGPFVVIYMIELETFMSFGNTVPLFWGSTNIRKWQGCSYWCIKLRDHQWQFSCKKGWVIWLIRWQIQKRGVIWHEIAQNPGNLGSVHKYFGGGGAGQNGGGPKKFWVTRRGDQKVFHSKGGGQKSLVKLKV